MDHSKLKVQLLSGKTPLLLFFRRHSLPPQSSFNAFRHHIIPAVREIDTRLSAVKHLLARQTFVLSTWLQVQSRRHNWILFCQVIGMSCSVQLCGTVFYGAVAHLRTNSPGSQNNPPIHMPGDLHGFGS